MYLGQIVELSRTEELFRQPKHPYTRALLSAVQVPDPRARGHRKRRAPSGDGGVPTTGCHFAARCKHVQDLCRTTSPPVHRINGADVLCHFADDLQTAEG